MSHASLGMQQQLLCQYCHGQCAFLTCMCFWEDKQSLCLFYFLTRVGVYVGLYECECTHTHTAYGVFGCEPRARDDTLGGLEESRWTKSRHICTRTCVQITHVYIYARRRDEILEYLLFFFNIRFLSKKKM